MAEESASSADKTKWSDLVQRHDQFLLDHMDPDFGLLAKLVTKRILSYEQRDTVREEKPVNKRIRKLLDIIRDENNWDGLFDTLRSTNQIHVVNYIEADGKYSKGDDWPLSEREDKILLDNHDTLIEFLVVSELTEKLYGMKVINVFQRDFIRAKQTPCEQNEAFIDILRRRSIGDYKKMVNCLEETKQDHIASLLREGGAIVSIRVNTNGNPEEERELACKINVVLGNKTAEERNRILELANVIAAKPGHSVILYVYLQTMKQMNQLKASLQSGLLKERVQWLFNTITPASKQIAVLSVTVTEDELSRVKDVLTAVDDSNEKKPTKRSYTTDEKHDKENNTFSTVLIEPMMKSPEPKRRKIESPLLDTTSSAIIYKRDDYIKMETVIRHRKFLEESLDSDSGILSKLLSKGTLNLEELSSVKAEQTHKGRNAKLLEFITDQEKCDSFFDSLRNTRQRHVVNYLIGDGSDSITGSISVTEQGRGFETIYSTLPTKESEPPERRKTESHLLDTYTPSATICNEMDDYIKLETLTRHKTFLEEIIDPDSGLLDELLSKGTLTRGEITSIEGRHTHKSRNAMLLKCITYQEKCDSFVASLRDMKQTHVVNYLICDGNFEDRFDDDWPLTHTQMHILNDSEESLLNSIDMDSLLEILLDEGVINDRQKRFIDSKQNSVEKNKAFLEIFRRMSQKFYIETMRCLSDADQSHVARILDEGGVILRIRVETNDDEANAELVDTLTDMIKEDGCISELAPIKVIAAETDYCGVALHVHCRELKDLEYVQMSLKSSQLKDSVERLFQWLLENSWFFEVFDITAENEDEVLRFFELKGIPRNRNTTEEAERRVNLKTLNDLPLELLDNILQLCYLLSVQKSFSKNLGDNLFEKLASVNSFWFQRMTKRKFRKEIRCRLSALFQRPSKSYRVVKNNRQFLIEFVQPSDQLIWKLESAQYLTKEQADTICKLRSDRDKTFELLHLLKPFDSLRIDTLMRCLRETKQNRVADVIDKGGAVVKVTAQTFDEVIKVIKRFNDHLSQRDQNLNSVKIFDNNIRRRKYYRGKKMKTFWIWLRDQSGFEALRAELEAKSVSGIDKEVLIENVISSSVNMDLKQFEPKYVSFSIIAEFCCRLNVDNNVLGITKLKDKIYVLCEWGIYVFDNRYQFNLQNIIEINEIKDPANIASSEKENCLYVKSELESCIWKIKEVENQNEAQKYNVVKWLVMEDDFFILGFTVTHNGEILLVKAKKWEFFTDKLNIYGSDAKLLRTIQLPEKTLSLRHASMTSTGNFIIVHAMKKSKKSLLLQRNLFTYEKLILGQKWVEERPKDETGIKHKKNRYLEEDEKRQKDSGGGEEENVLGEYGNETECGERKKEDEIEMKHEADKLLEEEVEQQKDFGRGKEEKALREGGQETECGEREKEDEIEMKHEKDKHVEEENEQQKDFEEKALRKGNKETECGEREKEEAKQGEEQKRSEKEKEWKYERGFNVISEFRVSNDMSSYVAHYIPPCDVSFDDYFALGSDGRLSFVDNETESVFLFDSDLEWDRILVPTNDGKVEKYGNDLFLYRVLYVENNRQLIVELFDEDDENVVIAYTLTKR